MFALMQRRRPNFDSKFDVFSGRFLFKTLELKRVQPDQLLKSLEYLLVIKGFFHSLVLLQYNLPFEELKSSTCCYNKRVASIENYNKKKPLN